MSKHLIDSVFVFQVNELCCVPCIDKNKKRLLECPGIVEVDADLEKKSMTIKGNIIIVELITLFQKIYVNADLVYYKKERWEDHDQCKEEECGEKDDDCSDHDDSEDIDVDCGEKRDMFKDYNKRKERRGKKEKEFFWNDDEVEDIGADHYKIRDTFKDHKPEAYVPPSKEYFWGDVRSGMQKKYPRIPGADSWYTAGFPNYNGFYYPAPWPQGDYM
ncbi:uncharacterized protein LOC141686583 [Apium graveolens]|uniref:uncharacterized protein LOC141686583 n=1 Tax=Apium graveolens TaxID=4045 RepID=UPI003D7A4EB5